MALVPIAQLLQEAEKGNYAVGAFNANNMEIVQAIMEAAQREVTGHHAGQSGRIKYAGLSYLCYGKGSPR